MRLPFHPIRIDDFSYGYSSSRGVGELDEDDDGVSSRGGNRVYFLSHFHTDHMKGLTSGWDGGYIYTTHTTRALLKERFGAAFTDGVPSFALQGSLGGGGISSGGLLQAPPSSQHLLDDDQRITNATQALLRRRGLLLGGVLGGAAADSHQGGANHFAPRVIAVDFEVRAWVPFGGGHVHVGQLPEGEDSIAGASARYLQFTFIPAHHIAGSAMIMFPSSVIGCVLYTGDFRYDPNTEDGATMIESIRFWSQKPTTEQLVEEVPLSQLVEESILPTVEHAPAAEERGTQPVVGNAEDEEDDGEHDAWLLEALLEGDEAAPEEVEAYPGDAEQALAMADTAVSHSRPSRASPSPQAPPPDRSTGELPGPPPMSSGAEAPIAIDHLFLDDTWLHLSTTAALQVGSGAGFDRLRSKLLTTQELHRAFRAVCTAVKVTSAAVPPSGDAPSLFYRRRPFIIRCYIHNNFGKEHLLMWLAKLLGTTVLVDDERYRLAKACCDPNSPDADVDPTLSTMDARYFTPWSQHDEVMRRYFGAPSGGGDAAPTGDDGDADDASASFLRSLAYPPCCIEVVSASGMLSSDSLYALKLQEERADWCGEGDADDGGKGSAPPQGGSGHGVHTYGIIMSGWAKLKGRASKGTMQVFDIPYSLHTSPEHLVSFVAALRPRSVSQLHYRDSRAAVMMSKLGRHLAVPYSNSPIAPIRPIPMRLKACAAAVVGATYDRLGAHHRSVIRTGHLRRARADVAGHDGGRAVAMHRRGSAHTQQPAGTGIGAAMGPAVRIRIVEEAQSEVLSLGVAAPAPVNQSASAPSLADLLDFLEDE